MAGIAISCGCIAYLKAGGIVGACLFSFGLLTVVHYGFKLYTGSAGFIENWRDFLALVITLLGNIVGCSLVAFGVKYAQPDLSNTALELLQCRLGYDFFSAVILGIGCGFVMTTSVQFARQNKFLPLLFGVPLFIICGFLHCIADACYYLVCPNSFLIENWLDILCLYSAIVVGNFIGCNLTRVFSILNTPE